MSTPADRFPRTSAPAGVALATLLIGYGLLDLMAGVPDSPLVPPLPAGVEPPRWANRGGSFLGLDRLSRAGATLLCLVVMVVLVAAFAVVVVEGWRGRLGRAITMVAVGAALVLAAAGPVLLSRDAFSYAAYGRLEAVHGANPYVTAPSAFPADPFVRVASPAWVRTRSVYGPAFTLASAAIAGGWSGSPGGTLAAFKILSAGAAGAAALLAGRAANRTRPGRGVVAAAMVGLNPVIVVHTVGGGHNDAIIAALLAGAWLVAARWRDRPTAAHLAVAVTVLLTLAALVKVVVGVALVVWLVALARRIPSRARVPAVGAHAVVAAALAAATSVPFVRGWRAAGSLAAVAGREGWASGARLVARGAEAVGRAIGGSGTATVAARGVEALFLAAFAVLAWRVLARTPPAGPAEAWGATLLLFALAGPYLLPWYAAWFVPFLAVLPDRRLAAIGLAACGVLALTGIPAEPGSDPALWRTMVLGVHYAASPIMLAAFVAAGVGVVRWTGSARPSPRSGRPTPPRGGTCDRPGGAARPTGP